MEQRKRYSRTISRDGKIVINVNVSTLRILQQCQRKADYIINHELVSKVSHHADFGKIIHKVMEDYYTLPASERNAEFVASSWKKHYDEAKFVPQDEKKTFETGLAALQKYNDMFINDDFEVVEIEGKKAIEHEFELDIFEYEAYHIRLFGTIDMIVRSKSTGEVFVLDHKTTSQLGAQFMQMWNPNHQMSCYIYATQKLGFECNAAVINGIQVVKTKQEIVRLTTRRTADQIQDFIRTIAEEAIRFDMNTTRGALYGADNYTCAEFGGCTFLPFCQADIQNRMAMIRAKQQELRTEEQENGSTDQSVTA
jgi:hypothetical protein